MKREINHDLAARKWAITESILEVALIRRVSTQLIRAEIIQTGISSALLSFLEKEGKNDKKVTFTVTAEDKLNTYFSQQLKKEVCLNGTLRLQMAA